MLLYLALLLGGFFCVLKDDLCCLAGIEPGRELIGRPLPIAIVRFLPLAGEDSGLVAKQSGVSPRFLIRVW